MNQLFPCDKMVLMSLINLLIPITMRSRGSCPHPGTLLVWRSWRMDRDQPEITTHQYGFIRQTWIIHGLHLLIFWNKWRFSNETSKMYIYFFETLNEVFKLSFLIFHFPHNWLNVKHCRVLVCIFMTKWLYFPMRINFRLNSPVASFANHISRK